MLGLGATLGATGAVLLSGCGRTADGRPRFRVQYDWLFANNQLGDICAKQLGYFKAEGISVEMLPGGPTAQTVSTVMSGDATLGQLSTTQLLGAFGGGRPLKFFACGYRFSPYGYISLPRAPIRKPRDLIGKTIGQGHNGRFLFELLLAANHIDPSQVHTVAMGSDMTPLLNGQVDAVTGFLNNTKSMAVLGPDRIIMAGRDLGLPGYANAYCLPADAYDQEKQNLIRFTRAVSRGWGFAFNNRKAAVDLMCDAWPHLDRAVEQATVDLLMTIAFDAQTRQHGWGWFDDHEIARQIALCATTGKFFVGQVPGIGDVSTREILDATVGSRPRLG